LAIEVYIDILISALVNVQDLKWETSSDYLAAICSFIFSKYGTCWQVN